MKFVFGFLVLIVSVIVVILLIVSILKGSGSSTPASALSTTYNLLEPTATDTTLRVTIQGPTVADENHVAVRYTISKNSRVVESLKGYKNTVDKSQSLPNSAESYRELLNALSSSRLSRRRDTSAVFATSCSSGNRYTYELFTGSNKHIDTWTSNCDPKLGTFAGDLSSANQLVRTQFPNLSDIPNAYAL
jgi:hypothetical protein